MKKNTYEQKVGLAEMLKGGVIMDVTNSDQANIAEDAGFHNITLPINAGAVGKFPAIDVKLKGVIAKTNPSKARYSK